MNVTGFQIAFTRFYWVSNKFDQFSWVVLGCCTGLLYWVVDTRFYKVIVVWIGSWMMKETESSTWCCCVGERIIHLQSTTTPTRTVSRRCWMESCERGVWHSKAMKFANWRKPVLVFGTRTKSASSTIRWVYIHTDEPRPHVEPRHRQEKAAGWNHLLHFVCRERVSSPVLPAASQCTHLQNATVAFYNGDLIALTTCSGSDHFHINVRPLALLVIWCA